jgi:hypothetical protein
MNFAAFVLLPVTYSVIFTFFLTRKIAYLYVACCVEAYLIVCGQDIHDGDLFRVSGVDTAYKLLYVLKCVPK